MNNQNLIGILAGIVCVLFLILISALVIKANAQVTSVDLNYSVSSVHSSHLYENNVTSNWTEWVITGHDGWLELGIGQSRLNFDPFPIMGGGIIDNNREYLVLMMGVAPILLQRWPVTIDWPNRIQANLNTKHPVVFNLKTGPRIRWPNDWPVQFTVSAGFNVHTNPISGTSVPGGHITQSKIRLRGTPYATFGVAVPIFGSQSRIVRPHICPAPDRG